MISCMTVSTVISITSGETFKYRACKGKFRKYSHSSGELSRTIAEWVNYCSVWTKFKFHFHLWNKESSLMKVFRPKAYSKLPRFRRQQFLLGRKWIRFKHAFPKLKMMIVNQTIIKTQTRLSKSTRDSRSQQ